MATFESDPDPDPGLDLLVVTILVTTVPGSNHTHITGLLISDIICILVTNSWFKHFVRSNMYM